METLYTDEKQILILIALLKAHGIRKVIASPGATNVSFVASLQSDPYFEIYSSVDERSAAYMACGLAAESLEPVVLSCTGATASRNYLPGLTEAYYRKLPVLAVTSTQDPARIGHHIAQVIDRSTPPQDTVKLSIELPIVKDEEDAWDCQIKANRALLELRHRGGGPVHINLPTRYSRTYDVKQLPDVRVIQRIMPADTFPKLPEGRIAIFVGSHTTMSTALTEAIDHFCAAYDSVVFCDHTSGYQGAYRVQYALAMWQQLGITGHDMPDLMIHIGEISGDYYSMGIKGRQVWRVNEDGKIRDTFRRLTYVFEMPELTFFEHYTQPTTTPKDAYLKACRNRLNAIRDNLPELPFSNIWIASKLSSVMPKNATVHLGILNSLRSWNLFELPESDHSASNVGGFGIDGGLSSLVGASLADPQRLCFCILGDLAFFYDMNALGNRHVGPNLRVLLINNGRGTEFRLFTHPAAAFGDEADLFMAAAGHYGHQSHELAKHYAEDLGFEYLTASNKEEFETVYERFITPEPTERPILFEVFTDSIDESDALKKLNKQGYAKELVRKIVGDQGVKLIKKILNR